MDDDEFKLELAKTIRVKCFLRANNIEFGYRFVGGPQDGNHEAHKKLFELVKMTHEENLKKIKEWEEEEDD